MRESVCIEGLVLKIMELCRVCVPVSKWAGITRDEKVVV